MQLKVSVKQNVHPLWSLFYKAVMNQLHSLDTAQPQQLLHFAFLPEKTPHNQ